MNKDKFIKIVISTVLVCAAAVCGMSYLKKIQVPESLRASRNDTKEVQVERYKQQDATIAIFYPQFENEVLNQKITEIKEVIRTDLNIQAEDNVKVDYTLNIINDSVISILFDVSSDLSNDVAYYSTLLDAKSYEEIELTGIFDESLLRKVSSRLRSQLKKMDSMQSFAYTLEFYEATASDSANFNTFLLNENRIDFVFSSNQYGIHPNMIISFDLDQAASHIALDLNVETKEEPLIEINERVIDPDRPMVAITFDDGPYRKMTLRLIEVFDHYGQAATFFMLGSRIPGNEDLIRELISCGNEAASHSYSHLNLNKLSGDKLYYELHETSKMIDELSGGLYQMKTFRAPFGASNDKVKEASSYPFIHWSIDTLDWQTRDVQSNIDMIINNVQDGDIILMHELYEQSVQAAEQVIPMLIEAGYQLVTVSELMEAKGIVMEAGTVYRSAN